MMVFGVLEILIILAIVFAIAMAVKSDNKKPLIILGVMLLLGGIFFMLMFFVPVAVSRSGQAVSHGVRMKFGVFPILLLPIIVVGLALFSRVENKKKVLTTILIIGVIVTLGIFSVRMYTDRQMMPASQYPPLESATHYTVTDKDQEEATIWKTGIEDQFESPLYPSGKAAVKGLINKMYKTLDEINISDNLPKVIELSHNTDSKLAEMLDMALRDKYKDAVQQIAYNNVDKFEIIDAGKDAFALQLVFGTSKTGPVSCILNMHFRNGERLIQKTWRTRYVDKPWVDNFARYSADNPSKSFALARSYGSCTSEEEAKFQAENVACRKVAKMLYDVRNSLHNPQRMLPSTFTVNPQDLKKYGLQLDSFSQQFYGSTSPIWRQAILLDISSDNIQHIASDKFKLEQYTYESWGQMLLKLLGVIALIAVVYLFLNTATRGYYTRQLIIAALVLLVIGVVFLLIFGI